MFEILNNIDEENQENRTDSQQITLVETNVGLSWKSWIKPISLFTFSSVVSTITSPFVAVTNIWKETTKLNFISGWNTFMMYPANFIGSELINSFFNTWTYLEIESVLDTIFISNLNKINKLKKVSKNIGFAGSLLFLNEIVKKVVNSQFNINSQEMWESLLVDFLYYLGKEIAVLIGWKIIEIWWKDFRNKNYLNFMLIPTLLSLLYLDTNVLQTLYNNYRISPHMYAWRNKWNSMS